MGIQILVRKATLDDQRAKPEEVIAGAEIDLIVSPVDGALVVVSEKNGVHICQRCGEAFEPGHPRKRGVEVKCGFTRILLHPGCVDGLPLEKRFWRIVSMHQWRRKLTRVVNASQGIEQASAAASKEIVR